MTVITMTREMGSLGKDVAAGLADEMGLEVIHHELVEHDVAERMSMPESDVHRFLEGTPSLLERWRVKGSALSRYTAEEIFTLAMKGDVLIRGWGATALLKRVPHVLRVRVCAPMAFRVDVMRERLGIDDPDVARREIERNDAAHTRIVRDMVSADWESPLSYDMVLNTERVPITDCVRQVRMLAESAVFDESEELAARSRRSRDGGATPPRGRERSPARPDGHEPPHRRRRRRGPRARRRARSREGDGAVPRARRGTGRAIGRRSAHRAGGALELSVPFDRRLSTRQAMRIRRARRARRAAASGQR